MNITACGHFLIGDFLGISSRLMYKHWFFTDYNHKIGYHDEAGDTIRGVLDTDIETNSMLSLNFDISFKVLEFRPSQWFSNASFWRTFDLDFHIGPFFDAALYNNPSDNEGFKNVLLAAGFELLIFSLRWQSIFFRLSYGHNFSLGEKKSINELFIGMELHY